MPGCLEVVGWPGRHGAPPRLPVPPPSGCADRARMPARQPHVPAPVPTHPAIPLVTPRRPRDARDRLLPVGQLVGLQRRRRRPLPDQPAAVPQPNLVPNGSAWPVGPGACSQAAGAPGGHLHGAAARPQHAVPVRRGKGSWCCWGGGRSTPCWSCAGRRLETGGVVVMVHRRRARPLRP